MSLTQLDIKNNEKIDGRACIMLCNFNGKELKNLKLYANMLGIRDQITLTSKNGNTIINNVLNNDIDSSCEDGRKEKAIIFNSIPPAKMNIFIENLKKVRLNNSLKAIVTETSQEWTINTVIPNLVAEKMAIGKGDFSNTHNS